MICNDSGLSDQLPNENQPPALPVPPKPFEFFGGEFVAEGASDDTWEIRHRDSDATALLCHIHTDPMLVDQQWQVAHSLCSGVAAFSTLEDAECYIATLLRLATTGPSICHQDIQVTM